MNIPQTTTAIRENILKKSGPFEVKDLYQDFNAINNNERNLIIKVFNDMYSEGIIVYSRFLSKNKLNTYYAFKVI